MDGNAPLFSRMTYRHRRGFADKTDTTQVSRKPAGFSFFFFLNQTCDVHIIKSMTYYVQRMFDVRIKYAYPPLSTPS